MRIVLLGNIVAGKSSTGNTIIGRKEFDTSRRTAECVKREGETAGTHITVVEAPGWWKSYNVEDTPERIKQEIVLSVSLCPPGPHALLLAIRVDKSFTEIHKRAVQEHVELLGCGVWSYSIVLFTKGDWLGDKSIRQHIVSGGESLQWVVEKCGNRYHVVDNKKSDGGQVTELMKKIEKMVAGNNGLYFSIDESQLKEKMNKKRREDKRAEQRKMKVLKRRETLRSSAGAVAHIPNLKILLLGSRSAGKSSSGNSILGRQEFDCPRRTAKCVERKGEREGRRITVVEVPGWTKKNFSVEARVKREIVVSVALCPPGPHAVLLVIRADVSFTETDRRGVQGYLELLDDRIWSQTIVLFTFGDWLGDTIIEQHIEGGGEALQWVVGKCGNRYHVLDNKKSGGDQVTELLEKIEEMVAGNSGCHVDFKIEEKNQVKTRKDEQKEKEMMKVQKQRETLGSLADISVAHKCDGDQVAEVVEKMENVVARNSVCYGTPMKQTQSKEQPPKMKDSGHFTFCNSTTEFQSSTVNLTYVPEGHVDKGITCKIPFVDEHSIQIKEFINEGSFGSVYKGSYQGTPVAVKKMPIGKLPPDSLELIIPLRLSHPYIVKMMVVSRKEHHLLVAYEYIQGANLHEIIHTPCSIELDEEDKMCVALEIGMAVEYIHGINIIHQDIKSANILVSERSKTASLTDWGLANIKDSQAQFGVAASGSMCGPRSAGTPMYMPPELIVHNERCTTMSDMWSLGLTYLEMFTGSVPWNLSHPFAVTGLLMKQERPHALAKLQPHLTEIVEPLVQYEPQARMTATALVTRLKSKVDLVKRYGFKF